MKILSPKKIVLLSGILAFAFVLGCTDKKADQVQPTQPTTGCDTTNVTYSAVIKPIIQSNCAISGCHTDVTRAGGYSYETYAGLQTVVQNGRLLGAIHHENGYVSMPENAPKLSDCDLEKITHWVDMGAPNN